MHRPSYPPGLWYSQVLPGGENRHVDYVRVVVQAIRAERTTNKGISPEVLESEASAAGWLLEALCQAHAHLPAVPLLLPGSRDKYTDRAPHRVPLSFGVMTRLKRALDALGWIESDVGDISTGYSRLRPAGAFLAHCQEVQFGWVHRPAFDPATILQIGKEDRGDDAPGHRRAVADSEGESVPRWRGELHAINEFLAAEAVYLRIPDTHMAEAATAVTAHATAKAQERWAKSRKKRSFAPKVVQFGRVALTRVFTGDLKHGGRLYGGWWQNVPSHLRRFIWIGPWQGYEVDFSGMAIRCLYAEERLPVPDDPYAGVIDFDGPADPRRSILKEFINALLNDKTGRYRLDQQKLHALGLTGTLREQAAELERRVRAVHTNIAHHFRSDTGLRMQFVDSEVAMLVLTRMMRRGVAVLPIHDSFIVPYVFREELVAEMQRAFTEVTGAQAKLKATQPAVVDHFLDPFIPVAMADDTQALNDKLDAEYARFGIANQYFSTWVQQMWSDARLRAELDFGEAFDAETLRHFALPLGLLRLGNAGADNEEEGGAPGGPGLLPLSSIFRTGNATFRGKGLK